MGWEQIPQGLTVSRFQHTHVRNQCRILYRMWLVGISFNKVGTYVNMVGAYANKVIIDANKFIKKQNNHS